MAATSKPFLEQDDKYGKRRSALQERLYPFLMGAFVMAVIMYLLAPGGETTVVDNSLLNGEPQAAVRAPVASTDPATQAVASSSTDSDEMDAYPKYEETAGSGSEMVSPRDVPAVSSTGGGSDASSSDEDDEAEEDEETAGDGYDEKNDGDLFEDQEEFDKAPIIQVLPESPTRKYSKIVLSHERYHRDHPARLYVPRLKAGTNIDAEKFRKLFMEKSQPVIIPFESMAHLNFTSKGYTLEGLQEVYPNTSPKLYKYGSIITQELDLGPATAELLKDKKLRKTSVGKSYPRNTKINLESLRRINMQRPAVIPDIPMMLPSLWFGPTSADTPLHSDCCDNWAMMVAGTKRWTVAPPSDARILKPACTGGLCWVKRLPFPRLAKTSAERQIRSSTQFLSFDLNAGEVLYLPAGWFHEIKNTVPTVMINFWSKNGPEFLRYYDDLVSGRASSTSSSHALRAGANSNVQVPVAGTNP